MVSYRTFAAPGLSGNDRDFTLAFGQAKIFAEISDLLGGRVIVVELLVPLKGRFATVLWFRRLGAPRVNGIPLGGLVIDCRVHYCERFVTEPAFCPAWPFQ